MNEEKQEPARTVCPECDQKVKSRPRDGSPVMHQLPTDRSKVCGWLVREWCKGGYPR